MADNIDLGWVSIDGTERGMRSDRYRIDGQSTLVTRATYHVAKYLAKHIGKDVTRDQLVQVLLAERIGANAVSVALGELKFALVEKYGAHKANQILNTTAFETVRVEAAGFEFTPEPAPAPKPRMVVTSTFASPPRAKPRVRSIHPDDEDGDAEENEDLRPIDELIRSVRVRGGAVVRNDDGEETVVEEEDDVEEEDTDEAEETTQQEAAEPVKEPEVVAAPVVEEPKPVVAAPVKKERAKRAPKPKAVPAQKEAVAKEPVKKEPVKKDKPVPSARIAFSKVRGTLPALLDTGDFVVTLNNSGKGHAAIINNTHVGITEAEYGILVDLFNARGSVLTSTQLGEKYYANHDRPTGTVAASMFKIRAALKKADVECPESIITTVKGSGFQYTGPNAPGFK